MNPFFSIIVPVFNSVKSLRQCVDSILDQTINDFELVLIDDGSTDGSSELCDYYSTLDKRIKTIHKSNGGVSSARNIGLDIAEGKWITFVDSDDSVGIDWLSCFNVSTNADLFVQGFSYACFPKYDKIVKEYAY